MAWEKKRSNNLVRRNTSYTHSGSCRTTKLVITNGYYFYWCYYYTIGHVRKGQNRTPLASANKQSGGYSMTIYYYTSIIVSPAVAMTAATAAASASPVVRTRPCPSIHQLKNDYVTYRTSLDLRSLIIETVVIRWCSTMDHESYILLANVCSNNVW